MSTYETSRVAVDPVVFTVRDEALWVLLKEREKAPFEGYFELPGGLLLEGETAEHTLQRKLADIFPTVKQAYIEQFHTFTDPKRDPRGRIVSIGFIAMVAPDALTTHDTLTWHRFSQLKKLAFDHAAIIRSARAELITRDGVSLARHLLPKRFRLNEIQKLLEVLQDTKLDNRNFRKWILASSRVKETAEYSRGGAFRPAKLFEFTS